MSDEGFSFIKFRMLLAFGIAFAALLLWSFFDLLFLLLGSDGMATVTDASVSTSRRGPDNVIVYYEFTEPDGDKRTGKTNIGDAAKPEQGEQFEIQYLPQWLLDAPDASRPKRGFNWIVLTLTLVALGGFGFFMYRAIYAPDEPTTLPSRRRR